MEANDGKDSLVMTFKFNRRITLGDVTRVTKSVQRLLTATHRHVTGNKRASFPLKMTHANFVDDGDHTLTVTIHLPKANAPEPADG